MLAAVALGDARRSASRGCRAGSRGRCPGTESSSRLRKRPSERFGGDRVDVREAGQVADERADGGAAPASRRQRRAAASRARAPRARTSRASSSTSQCSRKKPASPSSSISASSSSSRCAPRLWPLCRGSAPRKCRSQTRASWHVGRLGAVGEVGVAVAELLGQVEREPVGELDRARDGVAVVGEALEHSAGESRTHSWLPRRSGSQPSSEVRWRMATSASWSAARRGWCAWTSPVATVADAERRGEVAQRARCGARRRARTGAGARRRSGRGRTPVRAAQRRSGCAPPRPWRAQPERQTSPSFSSSSSAWSSGDAGGSGGSFPGFGRVPACALREQPAEVRVALRRLDEERHVRRRRRASPPRR